MNRNTVMILSGKIIVFLDKSKVNDIVSSLHTHTHTHTVRLLYDLDYMRSNMIIFN